MFSAISNFCAAFAAYFGFKRDQQLLENTPEMKAAAVGQADQQAKDAADKAIAAQDLATVRKDIAE